VKVKDLILAVKREEYKKRKKIQGTKRVTLTVVF
jgi:hypothetical protein